MSAAPAGLTGAERIAHTQAVLEKVRTERARRSSSRGGVAATAATRTAVNSTATAAAESAAAAAGGGGGRGASSLTVLVCLSICLSLFRSLCVCVARTGCLAQSVGVFSCLLPVRVGLSVTHSLTHSLWVYPLQRRQEHAPPI
jgi:hypothetical protein